MTYGLPLGWLERAAAGWEAWKHGLERVLWYQADSLHVVCGSILFVVLAIVCRKSVASPVPWSLLLVISSVNESIDIWFTHYVAESVKDTLLTILVPTLILVTARRFPGLYVPSAPSELPSTCAGETAA